MYKVKIKFDDGLEYEHPDISYDKFVKYLWEEGSSDIAYETYLTDNNMKELTDFNDEATNEITLIIEDDWSERVLHFKCVYDNEKNK